jgi:hypothetical protein
LALRLYGDAGVFQEALAAAPGGVYTILNRDRLDPGLSLRLERLAAERGHRDLLADATLRDEALADIHDFFSEAAHSDPEFVFAYSSKVVLALPEYQDIQKIFVLRRHFAANPDADVLALAPEERMRGLFAALFTNARSDHGAALPAARAWARFGRTLLRAALNRAPSARPQALVFSISGPTPRIDSDTYFGDLTGVLRARIEALTVYLASGPRLRLPRSEAAAPFEAFVSVWAVAAVWLGALLSGTSAVERNLPRGSLAPLHRYVRRGEVRSGEYFMQRLLARGFGAMLARLRPRTVIYPFENRSWEKYLLAAAHAHGARRVAYQHSSITPRHLAFRVARGEIAEQYLPDRMVTVGERTAEIVREWAPALAGRVIAGVSLRAMRQDIADAPRDAVLVAISSNRSEAASLIQATHAAASRVAVPFIVRTHPTIPVDDLFALFQWPQNVSLSAGTTLAQDLSGVTIVAYSSSTVALEGMLYGRLPVFVDIGDVPSGDPVIGEHAFKRSARGGAELAATIERVMRMPPHERDGLRAAAREYADGYLRAAQPEAVRAMSEAMLQA